MIPPSDFREASFGAPHVGLLPAGPRDAISDVPGVFVGHVTLADGPVQTGVTVVCPTPATTMDPGGAAPGASAPSTQWDPFRTKIPAGAAVINGFGKSVGLMQIDELGVVEAPLALTNTFSVSHVVLGQLRAAIAANPGIGRGAPSLNPTVFECNDGYLNDMQAFAVTEADYAQALASASSDFAQGAVGAGRGMSSFGLKGGIGSASRVVETAGATFTVGVLVLSNFGRPSQLTIAGRHVGPVLDERLAQPEQSAAPERGSIIMLVATDAPLDARQLRRVATRTGAGLARTGSVYGHGSGDVALAFTTGYTVSHDAMGRVAPAALVPDALLDPIFQATADATEQAILHALFAAESVLGRDGHVRRSLADVLPDWAAL
ncbi:MULTISPECIES: P1 family peptidase [Pandoraea]|uniref:DmpA family aminopeptidase n=1 Tax=Pandoraea TaxID=93217 RepID=UPI001F5E30B2|nr:MULTISPECIES: P1 family peptidase [Pandoraea]MCI3203476.1 aminopeptidase [Pandoraea sp. LA3]MDN4581502.1 aminopeptidase [Pandoraea capi]